MKLEFLLGLLALTEPVNKPNNANPIRHSLSRVQSSNLQSLFTLNSASETYEPTQGLTSAMPVAAEPPPRKRKRWSASLRFEIRNVNHERPIWNVLECVRRKSGEFTIHEKNLAFAVKQDETNAVGVQSAIDRVEHRAA